jgi:hypothetical protein
VHRAALQGRIGPQRNERLLQAGRAADDGELGPLEARPRQVIEKAAPAASHIALHTQSLNEFRFGSRRGMPAVSLARGM